MPQQPPAPELRFLLPPLILYPFTEGSASVKVLEGVKAALLMAAAEDHQSQAEQLRQRLLEARYSELRMLYFLGKDLFRWMAQCLDFSQRTEGLKGRGLVEQSFAEFLISQTPPEVDAKLRRWGVSDYARIFARSIGIHAQFLEPPPRQILAEGYLRFYFRFADHSYTCWREAVEFLRLSPAEFDFCLYASGEYSKMLEEQWQQQDER